MPTLYDIILPSGDEIPGVEADGYSRNDDRALFLHNDTATGPVGDFPPGTAIVETNRRGVP